MVALQTYIEWLYSWIPHALDIPGFFSWYVQVLAAYVVIYQQVLEKLNVAWLSFVDPAKLAQFNRDVL
jgi:hypothetical protein